MARKEILSMDKWSMEESQLSKARTFFFSQVIRKNNLIKSTLPRGRRLYFGASLCFISLSLSIWRSLPQK